MRSLALATYAAGISCPAPAHCPLFVQSCAARARSRQLASAVYPQLSDPSEAQDWYRVCQVTGSARVVLGWY